MIAAQRFDWTCRLCGSTGRTVGTQDPIAEARAGHYQSSPDCPGRFDLAIVQDDEPTMPRPTGGSK